MGGAGGSGGGKESLVVTRKWGGLLLDVGYGPNQR